MKGESRLIPGITPSTTRKGERGPQTCESMGNWLPCSPLVGPPEGRTVYGGKGSYGNFRPCLDVRFTKNVGCMIDRGARYKVYATIHTSQLSTPLRQEQRATRRFLEATPMKEVTFQRARESARGAVYESLSVRYRPRNIARPTAMRVGRAGPRSWWTHRLLQYVIAAA